MSPALARHPDGYLTDKANESTFVARHTWAKDIDEHTENLVDWDLKYDQLDCGKFEGDFIDVRWPGMQLFVEKTNRRIRQRGHLPPNTCGVGVALSTAGPSCVNGLRSERGALIVCDSAELDLCTPADCTMAGFVMDADLLREAIDRMSGHCSVLRANTLDLVDLPEHAVVPWQGLLLNCTRAVIEQPEVLRHADVRQRLYDDVVLGLISIISGEQAKMQPGRSDSRKRMVDKACEMLLSSPDEPCSLYEVCRSVGASPRKLGYCFQDVLGLSPARYIKAIRMNAVRRELSRPASESMSVYDVAARWGFWHFGHFSADYKRQFSELPSETLRRALQRH